MTIPHPPSAAAAAEMEALEEGEVYPFKRIAELAQIPVDHVDIGPERCRFIEQCRQRGFNVRAVKGGYERVPEAERAAQVTRRARGRVRKALDRSLKDLANVDLNQLDGEGARQLSRAQQRTAALSAVVRMKKPEKLTAKPHAVERPSLKPKT